MENIRANMICPVCNQLMVVLELQKIEIDYCPSCEGVWLDSGELELLIEASSSKTRLLDSFKKAKNIKENIYKCPVCSRKMDKVYCGDNNNVLIDKCKREHGLLFDRGELEKVVSLASFNNENKVVSLLKEMFGYNLGRVKSGD